MFNVSQMCVNERATALAFVGFIIVGKEATVRVGAPLPCANRDPYAALGDTTN